MNRKTRHSKPSHGPKWRASVTGEANHLWKGDKAGYTALHNRVRRQRGKASRCEIPTCAGKCRRFEWANLTGKYHDVNDYKQMCKTCHMLFDGVGGKPIKLTEERVKKIMAARGSKNHAEIAAEFSVSVHTVRALYGGRLWKKITAGSRGRVPKHYYYSKSKRRWMFDFRRRGFKTTRKGFETEEQAAKFAATFKPRKETTV